MTGLSVVVAARNAAGTLAECLDSLAAQAPPPLEVIVVDDASRDHTAAVAAGCGATVVSLTTRAWVARARNIGAEHANGDLLAFVDADDVVAPGWLAAVIAAFAAGADVVDYDLLPIERDDLVSRYLGARHARRGGCRPTWPEGLAVQGGWFAIRRSVFTTLGGFDPELHAGEDHDFLARAALAGYVAEVAAGAGYDHRPRATAVRMVRQRAVYAYWQVVLRSKYRNLPFLFRADRRLLRRATVAVLVALDRFRRRDRHQAHVELLDAASSIAESSGTVLARADLAVGRRRAPTPVPATDPGDAEVGGGLPPGPHALLVGDQDAVAAIASAARLDAAIGSPPAGMWPTSVAARDAPPRAPAAVVAAANHLRWGLPARLAARRLDAARAASEGEAVLALHGIHAWLGRKDTWIVSAGGAAGRVAASLLPTVPIVSVGATGGLDRPPDLSISADEVRRDPVAAVNRMAPTLGLHSTERVGAGLRAILLIRRLARLVTGRDRAA